MGLVLAVLTLFTTFLVLPITVLEHIKEPQEEVKRAARVLKKRLERLGHLIQRHAFLRDILIRRSALGVYSDLQGVYPERQGTPYTGQLSNETLTTFGKPMIEA